MWIAGGLYCWQNLLSVLLVISDSDPDFISFVGPDTQEKSAEVLLKWQSGEHGQSWECDSFR